METDLDAISNGTKPWKSLLQTTWDTYKERYAIHTAVTSKSALTRILTDSLKIAMTRKGPLFIKETPGGKTAFASVPASIAFEKATATDAEAAFAAVSTGEIVGSMGDDTIYKKKGPYGFYAECRGTRVPLKSGKDTESLEQIREKLTAKRTTAETAAVGGAGTTIQFERKVGDFTIKSGQYGFYFFKHTLKRVTFVKFPTSAIPDTVTATDLTAYYKTGLASKKRKSAKED